MFPFASHEEYGYKLASFASEVLAEAGKLAAEMGHRLTTHPGQVSFSCRRTAFFFWHSLSSPNWAHQEMKSSLTLSVIWNIMKNSWACWSCRRNRIVTPLWYCILEGSLVIRRQHLIDFAQIIKNYPLVLKRYLSWRMMMSAGLYMICYQSVRNLIFQWFWIIIIIILSSMPIEFGRDEGYHGLISKNSCHLDAKEYYSQNALLRTYPGRHHRTAAQET